MIDFITSCATQMLIFVPMALAIYISFCVMRATDLTLDGSFVLGAGVLARLITLNVNPFLAFGAALVAGAFAGMGVSLLQRKQKIDSLLAGILATFILTSGNLLLMGRPNINLLNQVTIFSTAFSQNETHGWLLVATYIGAIVLLIALLLSSRFGLVLHAFGDNPNLLGRLGKPIELLRATGFALTNLLAAAGGAITAQTFGYADIGMGFGMTLTALGVVILGKQIMMRYYKKQQFSISFELAACLIGVVIYFTLINTLLRLSLDPIYLKIILGILLALFLRSASCNKQSNQGVL